jgi:hypothetical protein
MAVQADGAAHIRVNVTSMMPQSVLNATNIRLGVRHVNNSSYQPDSAALATSTIQLLPATNTVTFTPASAAADTVDPYDVVYGQDSNADGTLQTMEVNDKFAQTPLVDSRGVPYVNNKALRDLFRVVTPAHISYCSGQLLGNTTIHNPFTDYAAYLIDAFVTGDVSKVTSAATGSSVTYASTIDAHVKLDHPVGGLWDSNCMAPTHKFTFGTNSLAASDFQKCGQLETRISQVVAANAAALKAAGSALAYDTPAAAGPYAADTTLDIPLVRGLTGVLKSASGSVRAQNRLGAAFGKCDLTGSSVQLRITKKHPLFGADYVKVEWTSFTGMIEDSYDFGYIGDSLPRQAAIIQAGYASLAAPATFAGRVFLTEVLLQFDNPPTFVTNLNLP